MESYRKFDKEFSRVLQKHFAPILFLHEAFHQLLVNSGHMTVFLRVVTNNGLFVISSQFSKFLEFLESFRLAMLAVLDLVLE